MQLREDGKQGRRPAMRLRTIAVQKETHAPDRHRGATARVHKRHHSHPATPTAAGGATQPQIPTKRGGMQRHSDAATPTNSSDMVQAALARRSKRQGLYNMASCSVQVNTGEASERNEKEIQEAKPSMEATGERNQAKGSSLCPRRQAGQHYSSLRQTRAAHGQRSHGQRQIRGYDINGGGNQGTPQQGNKARHGRGTRIREKPPIIHATLKIPQNARRKTSGAQAHHRLLKQRTLGGIQIRTGSTAESTRVPQRGRRSQIYNGRLHSGAAQIAAADAQTIYNQRRGGFFRRAQPRNDLCGRGGTGKRNVHKQRRGVLPEDAQQESYMVQKELPKGKSQAHDSDKDQLWR